MLSGESGGERLLIDEKLRSLSLLTVGGGDESGGSRASVGDTVAGSRFSRSSDSSSSSGN